MALRTIIAAQPSFAVGGNDSVARVRDRSGLANCEPWIGDRSGRPARRRTNTNFTDLKGNIYTYSRVIIMKIFSVLDCIGTVRFVCEISFTLYDIHKRKERLKR